MITKKESGITLEYYTALNKLRDDNDVNPSLEISIIASYLGLMFNKFGVKEEEANHILDYIRYVIINGELRKND